MYQYQVAEILQKLDMIIDFFKMDQPRTGNSGYASERGIKDSLDILSRMQYNKAHGNKKTPERQLDGRREARQTKPKTGRVQYRGGGQNLREDHPTSPTFEPCNSGFVCR